jgi:hypothetical protein
MNPPVGQLILPSLSSKIVSARIIIHQGGTMDVPPNKETREQSRQSVKICGANTDLFLFPTWIQALHTKYE